MPMEIERRKENECIGTYGSCYEPFLRRSLWMRMSHNMLGSIAEPMSNCRADRVVVHPTPYGAQLVAEFPFLPVQSEVLCLPGRNGCPRPGSEYSTNLRGLQWP